MVDDTPMDLFERSDLGRDQGSTDDAPLPPQDQCRRGSGNDGGGSDTNGGGNMLGGRLNQNQLVKPRGVSLLSPVSNLEDKLILGSSERPAAPRGHDSTRSNELTGNSVSTIVCYGFGF